MSAVLYRDSRKIRRPKNLLCFPSDYLLFVRFYAPIPRCRDAVSTQNIAVFTHSITHTITHTITHQMSRARALQLWLHFRINHRRIMHDFCGKFAPTSCSAIVHFQFTRIRMRVQDNLVNKQLTNSVFYKPKSRDLE